MKKRIFISLLILISFLFCTGFNFISISSENIESEKQFNIEPLTSFNDKNVKEYTLLDLEILLIEQKNIQSRAHDLAENARALGWPEDSDPITLAKIEWGNAQLAIDFYQEAYDKRILKIEEQKWQSKKNEYPEATEAWLYMKSLGWNDYVCAGIMGNLMTETGGQTLNIKPNSKGNGYYGICQWNKNHKSGVWGKSLKKQLDYLNSNIASEINTYGYTYKKDFNFNSFLALTDERGVALVFAKTYERCGSSSYKIRQENATKAYNYFTK
jgi:hypothetical protein